MLSNNEWLRLNDIILIIHSTESWKTMCRYFFEAIKPFVLFEKAMLYLLAEENDNLKLIDPIFVNVDHDFFDVYKSLFENSRYGRIAVNTRQTFAFRDSDLIPEFSSTDIYRSFNIPNKLPYGGGILLADNGALLAEIAFFRSEEQRDFTDKEIYILDILKAHLLTRLLREKGVKKSDESKTIKLIERGLTNREVEIIQLIMKNQNTTEISAHLNISLYTAKKHINNIYQKLGLNSRSQLIKLVSDL